MRQDVERLYRWDDLPPEAMAIYDSPDGPLEVEPTYAGSLVNEARATITHQIMDSALKTSPLEPFTLMTAHEAMANRDIFLSAFLVNPALAGHLGRARRTVWGKKVKVFVHDDVAIGDIYALAEPDFLGVLSRTEDGRVGVLLTYENGIVWGRFPDAR